MIQLEESNGVTPLCPYCEKPQETILFRTMKTLLGKRYVYFCSGCNKILGISHRKGFWMG